MKILITARKEDILPGREPARALEMLDSAIAHARGPRREVYRLIRMGVLAATGLPYGEEGRDLEAEIFDAVCARPGLWEPLIPTATEAIAWLGLEDDHPVNKALTEIAFAAKALKIEEDSRAEAKRLRALPAFGAALRFAAQARAATRAAGLDAGSKTELALTLVEEAERLAAGSDYKLRVCSGRLLFVAGDGAVIITIAETRAP